MRLFWLAVCLASTLSGQDETRRLVQPNSGKRLALVIGNSAYQWKPLHNPVNDARDVAQTLEKIGFAHSDITLVQDADRDKLHASVRNFVESVKPGDLAFVYYSGHGVEIHGENFLLQVNLPSDATENFVRDEAVSAQRILNDLDSQGARVKIMILDACRDNPLRAAKSSGGGLARMEGRRALVVFATEAGRTASDAPGAPHSLFTEYLLEGLPTPGKSLDDVMREVSRTVAKKSNDRQVPAIYGLLIEPLVLVPERLAQPLAESGWPLVGEEHFTGADSGWPVGLVEYPQGNLDRKILNGRYRITFEAKDNRFFWQVSPYGSFVNFSVAVDATFAHTDDGMVSTANLVFGISDAGYYDFEISSAGEFCLFYWDQKQVNVMIRRSAVKGRFQPGEWNRMRVVVDEQVIRCYLNSQLVGEFREFRFTGGEVALGAGTYIPGGGSGVVDFTDFELRRKP